MVLRCGTGRKVAIGRVRSTPGTGETGGVGADFLERSTVADDAFAPGSRNGAVRKAGRLLHTPPVASPWQARVEGSKVTALM